MKRTELLALSKGLLDLMSALNGEELICASKLRRWIDAHLPEE